MAVLNWASSRAATLSPCPRTAALVVITTWLLYVIGLAVYRLYFHPLARFPGRKMAAVTTWYEFYYDFRYGGKYLFEIEKMHKEFGPIVRINPHELSIHDPEYYNELYVGSSKRRTNFWPLFQGCTDDTDVNHFMTIDHDLHRQRRKPFDPFFSRMAINTRYWPMLAEKAVFLESRIREYKGQGKAVRLDRAFSAFSADCIERICTDDLEPGDGFLDQPDFGPEWYDGMLGLIRNAPILTKFPKALSSLGYVPQRLLLWLFPQGRIANKYDERTRTQIRKAVTKQHLSKDTTSSEHTTLFHALAQSNYLSPADKTEERLVREAKLIFLGGTISTGRTLSFVSYYVLSRPDIKARLEDELQDVMAAWPEAIPTWTELEKLPYLQAVIKEALRLSYGFMRRLPRVSPDVAIQYKEYTIPPGTPVGMSAYLMHSNSEVYQDPDQFVPERWLGGDTRVMQRSYVPFTRGSRSCLGQNLSMAEISLVLAVLFRPDGPRMELFETDESDVKHVHDFVVPLPKLDSLGVRVMIR
ncbi:cytochrome P450 [Neurospora hispaniola]|uniref:Cytochrome P450 n=1 Tax=Neurospora hispaniola TaxID=588809 RepID=A0AAJ0I6W4_9PEZI|nr:cytochrome P450 [Neurospora hispaniola]